METALNDHSWIQVDTSMLRWTEWLKVPNGFSNNNKKIYKRSTQVLANVQACKGSFCFMAW